MYRKTATASQQQHLMLQTNDKRDICSLRVGALGRLNCSEIFSTFDGETCVFYYYSVSECCVFPEMIFLFCLLECVVLCIFRLMDNESFFLEN